MGLTVKRSEISCCEKVFEYSMPLEEASETVVPDTMPDVERILCADGTALIRSKELGDGHISLAGSVQCTVLYAPEGGAGICALDVGIPAALELDAPGVSEDSGVVAMLTAAAVALMDGQQISVPLLLFASPPSTLIFPAWHLLFSLYMHFFALQSTQAQSEAISSELEQLPSFRSQKLSQLVSPACFAPSPPTWILSRLQ